MENDRRNHKISFRMNEKEYEFFMDKFFKWKFDSQGKFIRRMLLNGIVLHFDENKTKTAFRLISNIANNINQIAVSVNSTDNIYLKDISNPSYRGCGNNLYRRWRKNRQRQVDLYVWL